MNDHDWLSGRFAANRPHLRAVAYRMLGSTTEAEDAVQEAWLRVSRADTDNVENLSGWLTTIVARVCLDMLRSRRSRREEPLHLRGPERYSSGEGTGGRGRTGPETEAVLADSVGSALLVVLDTLAPAERLAFVLHDMFGVSFAEIAPIVKRSPAATRQLASRARRRVQGAHTEQGVDRGRERAVVDAFLAASRRGDFDALLALLDPDVMLRADEAAVTTGVPREVRGALHVAGTFSGRARAAKPATVAGSAGAAWAPGGRPRVAFAFRIENGRIVRIDLLADPERLRGVELVSATTGTHS